MSGKNRAFALAVATAALVGMSAPVASAATFQGGPGGFNHDSVLNLSGNQLPVQTCTSGAAVNTVTETQALTGVLAILPVPSTGAVSPMQGNTCTQSTTETHATAANTAHTADPSSNPGPSGFNHDSVLNLSGNQLPVQTCTSGAAVNTVTETQALTGVLANLPVPSTGAVSPMQGNTCTQSTTETNTTTAHTGN